MVKWFVSGLSALFVFVLDRLSKVWILKKLSVSGTIKITNFLNIVHVMNKGGLWGVGRHSLRSGFFFIVVSFIAIAVVLALIKRLNERDYLSSCAFGFILGGGIGNLFDRFVYGSVIDFIDLHLGDLHWPAFNFADTFIVIGIIMLLIFYRPQSKKG